jgi:nucleoid DNA-binding protein
LQARQKHGVEDTNVNLNGLRNNYILNKLQTISTEELPLLAQGLGVSSISLINTFGKLLSPTENKVKGVNAFYQRNIEYWTSQLNHLGIDKETVDTVLNKTFEVIAKALKNGESISIDEFGLFYKKTVSERNTSNISTLEFHRMPNVRHELIFVPYPELLFQINFTEDGF